MAVTRYNPVHLTGHGARQDRVVVGVLQYRGRYFGWFNEGSKRSIANYEVVRTQPRLAQACCELVTPQNILKLQKQWNCHE